jgi:hypothetical protein
MKRTLALLALAGAFTVVSPVVSAAQDKPVRVAYYYKVRWGFQQEFERLFLKNHYPLLAAQAKDGKRIRSVELLRPTFHGEGRSDWTFLVEITYSSWAAIGAPSGEEDLARRLFPDQETYRREEQRRFEILDAHWDVPLTEVEAKP